MPVWQSIMRWILEKNLAIHVGERYHSILSQGHLYLLFHSLEPVISELWTIPEMLSGILPVVLLQSTWLLLFICLVCFVSFFGTVSLCSPGFPGTCSENQAVLKLKDLPTSYLLLHPECWNERFATPLPSLVCDLTVCCSSATPPSLVPTSKALLFSPIFKIFKAKSKHQHSFHGGNAMLPWNFLL